MRMPDMLPLPTDTPPVMPGPPGGGPNGPGLYNGAGQPSPPFALDGMNLGRDELPEWTPAVWARIDQAAVCEIDRASVAAQFLPKVLSLTPSVRTVPANSIAGGGELNIDQTKVLPLLEESQLFFLGEGAVLRGGGDRDSGDAGLACGQSVGARHGCAISQGQEVRKSEPGVGRRRAADIHGRPAKFSGGRRRLRRERVHCRGRRLRPLAGPQPIRPLRAGAPTKAVCRRPCPTADHPNHAGRPDPSADDGRAFTPPGPCQRTRA